MHLDICVAAPKSQKRHIGARWCQKLPQEMRFQFPSVSVQWHTIAKQSWCQTVPCTSTVVPKENFAAGWLLHSWLLNASNRCRPHPWTTWVTFQWDAEIELLQILCRSNSMHAFPHVDVSFENNSLPNWYRLAVYRIRVRGAFHCAENRDWKLIFISRGHVLCDWHWRKIDVTDRTFCLADENNGRKWRWRIHKYSCCTCCVCYDRLSSEDVLVITSCTARVRHKYS